MNSAAQVDEMIANWKQTIQNKAELSVLIANACMGWPYIFGDRGELCTPDKRKAVHNSHPDQTGLITKCQVLNGKKGSCGGCQWYPNGKRVRSFDCRGFTYWVILQATGEKIMGAGATSQYNDNSNWQEKGEISKMPNVVCCVFKYKNGKMQHTGLHIGDGKIIHCSNGVQTGKTSDKGWTHYAIPKALYSGTTPTPAPTPAPTPTPTPTPESGTGIVTGKSVAMRQGPTVDASVILRVPTGKTVKIASVPEDWIYIEYNGKRGFMMKKFLNIKE